MQKVGQRLQKAVRRLIIARDTPQSGQLGLTRGLATAQAQMMNVKLCREVYALALEAGPKKIYWMNVEEPATYRFNNAPGATLSMSTAGRDRARSSKPPRSWDLKYRL